MPNDEYPGGRHDPLRSGLRLAAIPPSFLFASLAFDHLTRLREAQSGPLSMDEAGFARDLRAERMTRAGYLAVVGIDRLVRAVAVLVWRIARSLMKQRVTRRQVRGSAAE